VKEIDASHTEEIKRLFRNWLNLAMASYPSCFMQGLESIPKCIGITKIDRRTLFCGMALRNGFPSDLETALTKSIKAFLTEHKLDTESEEPVKIKVYHMRNTESEFVLGKDKAVATLQTGPKAASDIAKATALDEQLNNILLCLLEEESMIRREEKSEDDIFHLVKSGSLAKTE